MCRCQIDAPRKFVEHAKVDTADSGLNFASRVTRYKVADDSLEADRGEEARAVKSMKPCIAIRVPDVVQRRRRH